MTPANSHRWFADNGVQPRSDSQRHAFLDSYRLIAIIMVIGIHSFAYVQLEPRTEIILRIIVQTIAVQVFFLVDGYLFSGKIADRGGFRYLEYIKKSSRRLLFPWALMSLIYTGLRYVLELIGAVDDNLLYRLPLDQAATHIYASVVAPQLYFLLSLFLIRCLSFWTRYLITLPLTLLVAFFGLYSLFYWSIELKHFFLPGQDPVLHALWGFQYYMFGMLLQRSTPALMKKDSFVIATALALTVLIRLLLAITPHTTGVLSITCRFISQYSYLIGTFYLFYKYATNPSILSRTGRYTMGIYLLHAPGLLKISSLLTGPIVGRGLVGYLALISVCFLLSLGFTRVIRIFSIGRWILGERPFKTAAMPAVHSM